MTGTAKVVRSKYGPLEMLHKCHLKFILLLFSAMVAATCAMKDEVNIRNSMGCASLENQDFSKRHVLGQSFPMSCHPNKIRTLVPGKGVRFLAIMIHEMWTVRSGVCQSQKLHNEMSLREV